MLGSKARSSEAGGMYSEADVMLGSGSLPLYAFHMPVFSAVLSVGVSVYTGIVAAIIALSLATLIALLGARRTQRVLKFRRART